MPYRHLSDIDIGAINRLIDLSSARAGLLSQRPYLDKTQGIKTEGSSVHQYDRIRCKIPLWKRGEYDQTISCIVTTDVLILSILFLIIKIRTIISAHRHHSDPQILLIILVVSVGKDG